MLRRPPRPPRFPYTAPSRSITVEQPKQTPDDRPGWRDGVARLHHHPDAEDLLAHRAAAVQRLEQHAIREERSEQHTSNSSHSQISYAVFCLKKKEKNSAPSN